MKSMGEINNLARKKVTKKAIVIFTTTMVLLTFFSSTINNFTLPRVKAEKPTNGYLVMEISGDGVVEARESIDIYADAGRKVEEIHVKNGDRVKKGQVIATLEKESIEKELEVEQLRLEKLKLQLEKQINASKQSSLSNLEKSMEVARLEMEDTAKNLEIKKKLYGEGGETAANVRAAQKSYDSAKLTYEQRKTDYLAEKDNEEKKAADNERDIKDKQYDIKIQEKKVEDIRKKLDVDSTVYAPAEGVITEVNVSKGSITNNSKPSLKMLDTGKGFEIRVAVDIESAGYLTVGEAIEVNMTTMGSKKITGKLAEIRDSDKRKGEKKDLVISLPGEGLSGGEKGEIYITKRTKSYMALVPNEVVHEDNDGKYVLLIKERKGPLGSEYYLQRANIQVDASDNSKSAVTSGASMMDRIVISSSKQVSEGSQVVLIK